MSSIPLFAFKYFFRTLHMASFAILFGNFTLDAYFGERTVRKIQKKEFSIISHSAAAILLISGFINMIILIKENKYLKNFAYTLWKYILIIKFVFTIAITPLLEKILPLNMVATNLEINTNIKPLMYFKIRLTMILIIFLLSPFTRYLREGYMIKNTHPSAAGVKKD